MKKILLFTLFCVMVMLPYSLTAQTTSAKKIIPGIWKGKLTADGTDLTIIFKLNLAGADTLKATLDSPDQGGFDIPMGKVTVEDKKLIIEAPDLNGEYRGVLTGDSTIDGTWSQNGAAFPLNLKKQVKKL